MIALKPRKVEPDIGQLVTSENDKSIYNISINIISML